MKSRKGIYGQDECVATITNTGLKRIKRYQLDVWFPEAFLTPNGRFSWEVSEGSTPTHRLLRVMETTHKKVLYPGDSEGMVVQFLLDAEALDQKIKAIAYSGDSPPLVMERSMVELQGRELTGGQ